MELRNALDEAVQALESLDASKGGAGGGASVASPANQCVCHVGNCVEINQCVGCTRQFH